MFRRTKTKAILRLIKANGRTQIWLAEKIGYHPVHFNDIIHNRNGTKLNPQKVSALAELLGVSPEKLSRLFALPKPHVKFGGERI